MTESKPAFAEIGDIHIAACFVAIDPDCACAQAARCIVSGRQVGGPDRRGQTIFALIGDPDGLIKCIEGNHHRQHQPEDLFARELRLIAFDLVL